MDRDQALSVLSRRAAAEPSIASAGVTSAGGAVSSAAARNVAAEAGGL